MSEPYQSAGAGKLYDSHEIRDEQPPINSDDYLHYLFVAEFGDGEQIAQTQADRSLRLEGKSAFMDVLEKSKTVPLLRFHLTDNTNWYTVDLTDGKFEINGFPFDAHPQMLQLIGPLTLVYYCETRAERYSDNRIVQYINRYFIGWWFRDADGKKVEQTIAIA